MYFFYYLEVTRTIKSGNPFGSQTLTHDRMILHVFASFESRLLIVGVSDQLQTVGVERVFHKSCVSVDGSRGHLSNQRGNRNAAKRTRPWRFERRQFVSVGRQRRTFSRNFPRAHSEHAKSVPKRLRAPTVIFRVVPVARPAKVRRTNWTQPKIAVFDVSDPVDKRVSRYGIPNRRLPARDFRSA